MKALAATLLFAGFTVCDPIALFQVLFVCSVVPFIIMTGIARTFHFMWDDGSSDV